MFSLICAWINDWVNNRKAGDLRRHRAHYDVTVMTNLSFGLSLGWASRTLSTESMIFVLLSAVLGLFWRYLVLVLWCLPGVDGSALLEDMGLCFFYLTACPAKDVIVFISEVTLVLYIWHSGSGLEYMYYAGFHYDDVIMGAIASHITSLIIVYSTVYSDADQRKHLRVTGLCVGNSPGPVNSPHKGPVTRKMFPFDDVIMYIQGVHWRTEFLFPVPK